MRPCPTHRRAYAGRLHTGGTPATIMELDWGHLVHDIAGLCKYTGDKPEEVGPFTGWIWGSRRRPGW